MTDELYARAIAAYDQAQARHRDRWAQTVGSFRAGIPEGPGHEPVALWQEAEIWCAILTAPSGALCGYARLPAGHPWEGLHFTDPAPNPRPPQAESVQELLDDHGALAVGPAFIFDDPDWLAHHGRTVAAQVPVHGGLTYTGPMPITGAPHGWWIGFDCGHCNDGIDPDRLRALSPGLPPLAFELMCEGHCWTQEEVQLEVKRMIPPILEAMDD